MPRRPARNGAAVARRPIPRASRSRVVSRCGRLSVDALDAWTGEPDSYAISRCLIAVELGVRMIFIVELSRSMTVRMLGGLMVLTS
jgi:hypothetical protein